MSPANVAIRNRTEVYTDSSISYAGREMFTDVNCTTGGVSQTLSECSIGERYRSSCENPNVGTGISCVAECKESCSLFLCCEPPLAT